MNPRERASDQAPKKDLDRDLVLAYAATFIPRDDTYPLQLETGHYITLQRQLYPDLIAAHLKGFITIGAYALDRENKAKWICFDADDTYRWNKLIGLARTLAKQQVTPYLEPSRRGGHLWLFTSPLPGVDMRRFGKQLLADYKIDKLKIVIYPKQDQLVTGPGSFVRLPLGKHRLTGHRYHFITPDGTILKSPDVDQASTRDQIRLLSHPQRVPLEFIESRLVRAPAAKTHSPTPAFEPIREAKLTRKGKRKGRQHQTDLPSERIKGAISVSDFVSQYVELDDQGRGHCPFHDDQARSFSINQDHNFWHCFACEKGGSIIDFWMLWRKKRGETNSFKTTITDLAKMLLK